MADSNKYFITYNATDLPSIVTDALKDVMNWYKNVSGNDIKIPEEETQNNYYDFFNNFNLFNTLPLTNAQRTTSEKKQDNEEPTYNLPISAQPTLGSLRTNIVNYGRNLLGGKYVSGGKYYPEKGLDCSGFTYQIYKAFGYDIGTSTYDQMKKGVDIGKDISKALPGDLVIVASESSPSKQHVELVTGIDNYGRVWSMGARGVNSGIKESIFPFKTNSIKTIRRILS